ncbi:glycosyltransferase family 4 protein [Pseudarthrobacter sulfonivorans]|uniref:glycosyltransferase family 4 protein n=1 Tax=Pseudarthrobacter sulfonivorans TaxID=121292 RepID=UPI002863CAF8|nr:glycosyltransferase family 4 protein [Pseudarthrobacter sulfonivorans]MDR6414875.1 glycosyltransferase involved in cell wall biosynthesis [Pseudarthrobacter sulfonivorans]
MKIVQMVNTLSIADGGPARNSFELNRALNRMPECKADLFWIAGDIHQSVLYEESRLVADLPSPGPRRIGLRSDNAGRWLGLLPFLRTLRSADALIIHGYYLVWVPFASLLGRLFNCCVFIMPHGALTVRQQGYSRFKKFIFDASAGLVTRLRVCSFVTGSMIEREELVQKFAGANVQVAGVGVPIPTEYRQEPQPHDPIRLLSFSRIAEKKRIDLSIDALAHLKERNIDASLTIAGEGPLNLIERLAGHALSRGVSDNVRFVGQLSGAAKMKAFIDSDFFLLPSEDENFGIGFAEAVSFGLPCVVSTNVAAAKDLPVQAGRLVRNPTGETLAAAVIELMAPTEYLAAQSISRDYAVESFSWSAAAEQWMAAIVGAHALRHRVS